MIYVDSLPSEWSRKHQLPITTRVCPCCNESYPLDVPVAIKGYRGFMMKKHQCPEKKYPRLYKPVDQTLKIAWARALY